jgi:hypothetical protein
MAAIGEAAPTIMNQMKAIQDAPREAERFKWEQQNQVDKVEENKLHRDILKSQGEEAAIKVREAKKIEEWNEKEVDIELDPRTKVIFDKVFPEDAKEIKKMIWGIAEDRPEPNASMPSMDAVPGIATATSATETSSVDPSSTPSKPAAVPVDKKKITNRDLAFAAKQFETNTAVYEKYTNMMISKAKFEMTTARAQLSKLLENPASDVNKVIEAKAKVVSAENAVDKLTTDVSKGKKQVAVNELRDNMDKRIKSINLGPDGKPLGIPIVSRETVESWRDSINASIASGEPDEAMKTLVKYNMKLMDLEEKRLANQNTGTSLPTISKDYARISEIDKLDPQGTNTQLQAEKKSLQSVIKKLESSPGTVPSAGNSVDLAIMRHFKDPIYLNDPEKAKIASAWLDTTEGRNAVREARDDTQKEGITYLSTDQGMVPMPTTASKAPPIGKPTGLVPPLSEDFKKDYTAIGQASDLVTSLKSTWDSLKIGIGESGRLQGTKSYLAGKTAQNANAKLYLDNREAFLGNLSRSLAAERGVLTQQDIDRVARAIPKIGLNALNNDNKEEADKKWAEIFKLIENAEKRAIERSKMRTEKPSPIISGKDSKPNQAESKSISKQEWINEAKKAPQNKGISK